MTETQSFERVAKEAIRVWKAKITSASLWDIARSFAWAEGFGRKRVVRVQKLALELSKEKCTICNDSKVITNCGPDNIDIACHCS